MAISFSHILSIACTFVLSITSFLPVASAASSSSTPTADPSDPTAPSYTNDITWLTAYITIHSLSLNSYVYMYIFWFLVCLIFFALSFATWTEVRASALGARWSKWALRRRTWRKKHTLKKNEEEARKLGVPVSAVHRQPRSLPSNAQIMTATVLTIATLVICFVGPDYLNPDLPLFDFSGSSSSSSSSVNTKRDTVINDQTMAPYIAHYNIQKAWWTSAARTGGVAFALFPLVVVLALKAPPFALFGIPGLVQYGHDKMIRLHRYVGRLVWFVTFLHVVFWVVQVLEDRRASTGKLVFVYVWEFQKFRFAWVAFISMTILMIFSLDCIRNPHYELFYAVHVIFTPMTIIFSALHHPQRGLWGWCAAALVLWAGERVWRAFWWVYVNGIFGLGGKGGKGRTVQVGSISPYVYSRPGEKRPLEAHRLTPSHGNTTTLTNPNAVIWNKEGKEPAPAEQWEMNALRAPAPRRPPSNGIMLGRNDNEGYFPSSRPTSPPPSSASSAHGITNPRVDIREDEPTPTPGELMEVARVQIGNGAKGANARGTPLHIQTAPVYPPAAHPRLAYAQSPGAGPGPRSSARRLDPTSTALQHRFQPHPTRPRSYAPPPGFSLATLLPGRTIRLRLVTPGYQTWAPGQHFLVGIPSVSRVTTHPFSVASVCDEQAALFVDPDSAPDPEASADPRSPARKLVQAEAGRELVLLVRAKKGWTKRLWDLISSLHSQGLTSPPTETLPAGSAPPPQGTPGVVLRTFVDGPFGSAGRTCWGRYSSVLIISGGSGVSFGLSVLEYICLCIAGRDGRFLGGVPGGWGVGPKGAWVTQRVRFVWLVREYAHIQWVASSLRRCLTIVPTDALELNIFVTNVSPPVEMPVTPSSALPSAGSEGRDDFTDDGHLKPPAPRFLGGHAGGGGGGGRGLRSSSNTSDDSLASDVSVDSIVDSYFEGDDAPDGRTEDLGHETHMLDYTNFDGDDDTPMPGEHRLSKRIIKEGKMRRARSRKVKSAENAKRELEERAAAARADPYAYSGHGHGKSPSSEYGHDVVWKRSSANSTAPLLPYSVGSNRDSGISPVSSVSAFSVFDGHVQSQLQPQRQSQPYSPALPLPAPPPSSFTSFGASGNELSSSTSSSSHARRYSASSSWTLKDPSASTPSLTPSTTIGSGVKWVDSPTPSTMTDLKAWSGSSAHGALGSGLALDPQEVRDLQIVSEWARAGKPKLGRILADEVEHAKGRIAVACCGPTGLNALMRKHIAEQINPGRVARGDMRGSIDFIAEDFEY